MQDPLPVVPSVADLRRGMELTWEWSNSRAEAIAHERGLLPQGTVVTQADFPGMPSRLGVLVNGSGNWITDPVSFIAAGGDFHLIRAAEPPTVLNAKVVGKNRNGAIYIGRPSEWGNPFVVGKHGDRDQVLDDYVEHLHANPEFVDRVRRRLAGCDLICWCAPDACHGHILRDLAMGAELPAKPERNQIDMGF